MPYTFQAGPEEDRYTVETPWTTQVVDLVASALSRLGFTRHNLHAAMLMLLSGLAFDGMAIESVRGEAIIVGEIRSMLDAS
jgi:hypothetical protein